MSASPMAVGAASKLPIAGAKRLPADLRRLLFVALHLPLGLLLYLFPPLSTAHALVPLAVGVALALSGRRLDRVIFLAAYIVGGEIAWRMLDARVFHEYGKYACALLLLMVLGRIGSYRPPLLPLLYFLSLIPSASLAAGFFGVGDELRQQLSFNLSGPFLLLVASWMFLSVDRDSLDLRNLTTSLLAPVVSTATVVVLRIRSGGPITFISESSFEASGGFGPNQVSAILGLGSLMAFLLALDAREAWQRVTLLALAAWLLTQALITFSRGGVLNVVLCLALLSAHLLLQRGVRTAFVLLLAVGAVVLVLLVLPAVETWTSGMLSHRYFGEELEGERRLELYRQELRLFQENPLLGVGVGVSPWKRWERIAPHTEFTRLLGEHGALGAFALGALLLIALRAYSAAPHLLARAWVATMAAWALLEMSHAAMRIAATSLVFGMALIQWPRKRE